MDDGEGDYGEGDYGEGEYVEGEYNYGEGEEYDQGYADDDGDGDEL